CRRHEGDQSDLRGDRRARDPPRARGDPARHGKGPRAPPPQRQARDHRRCRDALRAVGRGLARTDPRRPGPVSVAASGGRALRRDLGLLPLVAIVFFNVSGGPYGIEDAVSSFGPGLTLLLLALTPIVWSLPVALAMAEMASAMPE